MKRPENRGNGFGAQMSLLDQQAESISFPAPGSHCAIIGSALLGGAILNSSDVSQSRLETTKLTSRVSDLLIKFGWSFVCKAPATRVKSNGRLQRVVFYNIPTASIRALRKHPRVRAWLSECRKGGV